MHTCKTLFLIYLLIFFIMNKTKNQPPIFSEYKFTYMRFEFQFQLKHLRDFGTARTSTNKVEFITDR